ncbi:MAG: hypothetical protein D9N11_13355 [Ketobacter sp.]|nr:MAG: hypothetical protein D9N11_13355 [Ketobacter sp.]
MCDGKLSLPKFLCATLLFLSALLVASPGQAEQYRSKLLLNPQQSLSESARLSISEMESRFKELNSDYARASVGSQLARHFVQQGDYQKAIEYYQSALQADALSPLVAADLRRELAEIYLLDKQPQQALSVLQALGPVASLTDAKLALAYARVRYELGDYLKVAAALERFMQLSPGVDERQFQQVVALAYGIQDFDLCGRALKQLIEQDMATARYWSQMVSVLLKQNKVEQALHYLILARQLGLLQDQANSLLLSSLYASQGNPFTAAERLQQAMAQGIVVANGEHYKRLFEYWWQAREEQHALNALEQAAKLTGEAPLYLFWAQTLMQRAQWQKMNSAILQLCEQPIAAEHSGHANLLLGISLYEQGKKEAAFDAFASATLTGGVNAQAGNWLAKLESEGIKAPMPSRPKEPCKPGD